MKKCPMCGIEVEDHASECPECGCPIADTSGFSLKSAPSGSKKSGNPMGKSISTGSGLTDLLREGDDAYDDFDDTSYGGSIPLNLMRNDVEDYKGKKKSKIGKILFRIILIAALAYGAYYLVVNVFMTKKARSYKEAVDFYVEGINDSDVDTMKAIIPPYVDDREEKAQKIIDSFNAVHIDDYNIKNVESISKFDIEQLQDAIKLSTGKTARIKEACSFDVEMTINVTGNSIKYESGSKFKVTSHMEYININDKWYLQIDSYEHVDYN